MFFVLYLHCVSIPCIYSMFFVLFLVFTLYVLCPFVCPVCPFLCLSTSYLPCVSVHRALMETCAIKVDIIIIIIMCPLSRPDEDLCAGSVCQQTCSESSDGRSFTCSCKDGYLLNEDQRTCRGTFLLLLVMLSVCQRKTDEQKNVVAVVYFPNKTTTYRHVCKESGLFQKLQWGYMNEHQ